MLRHGWILVLAVMFFLGFNCEFPGQEDPTWYRDVLPIVQTSCQGCHVTGGIAPFPLETYEDAASRSDLIAYSVQTGFMPPWMPSQDCQSFQNERTLTDAQIKTFEDWNAAGAPEGDPEDAPDPPEDQPGLPWVDAVLDAGADYTPNDSERADDYHCFVLDPALESDQFVIGLDLVPGVRRMVHHVIVYSAEMQEALAQDALEEGLGWTCFGGTNLSSTQMLGGWVPGSPASQYPPNTGISLHTGRAVVIQIHYNFDSGPAEPDRTQILLQYAKEPVEKPASFFSLSQREFEIPPHTTNYSVSKTIVAEANVLLWGVLPHMHQLGKQIKVERGDFGADTCLIDIPKWDFHWQQTYFYDSASGLSIRKGDPITLTCTWDNPTDQPVRWGEGTSDEMCLNYFYLTAP